MSPIAPTFVVAVITHDNLRGLQGITAALLTRARAPGLEVLVVDSCATPETKAWLQVQAGSVTVLPLPSNRGPAAARNAVLSERPEADVIVYFDDDVILQGHEIERFIGILAAEPRVALISGIPTDQTGRPLAQSFSRRPLQAAVARLWERWWGTPVDAGAGQLLVVDAVGASAMAVRGQAARVVGGFDETFAPIGFEDLDFCAKLRFAGYGIAVDPDLLIRQEVSVTARKVFGAEYPILRRSNGVMYAAMDYPIPLAAARLVRALLGAFFSASPSDRCGDARGLLRCARAFRTILAARRYRRTLRDQRARNVVRDKNRRPPLGGQR